MKLYLDEHLGDPTLVRLLRQAGHDVLTTHDAGNSGRSDPGQLLFAIGEGRAIITEDHLDYRELHQLILGSGGGHAGILVIRNERDPRGVMSERAIATSVKKLEAAGIAIASTIHTLNHWR